MLDVAMIGMLLVAFAGAFGYVRACVDLTPPLARPESEMPDRTQ